jgi:uncharacterized protein YggE
MIALRTNRNKTVFHELHKQDLVTSNVLSLQRAPTSLLALNKSKEIGQRWEIGMYKRIINFLGVLALITVVSGQVLAKETTIRGHLQPTVEAGGWLIVTSSKSYLLLNANQFKNESWFKESTEVEATGQTKDVMTIYMQGTPFEARTLKAVGQGGQAVTGAPRSATKVTVAGDSIVQAQPDTAILTLSVVTQSKTAIEAQQENARKSDALVRTLKSAAGANAEVKTSGYVLQPMRVYRENQPPTITGYEARNSVTVVLSDLTKVGTVIDAAAQAGANDVSGISFSLKQDRPARDEALRQATREAMSKAQVMAQALGGRVVRIVEVQEEGTVRPLPMYEARMDTFKVAGAATPIEVGTLDVTARVQLVAEVEIG